MRAVTVLWTVPAVSLQTGSDVVEQGASDSQKDQAGPHRPRQGLRDAEAQYEPGDIAQDAGDHDHHHVGQGRVVTLWAELHDRVFSGFGRPREGMAHGFYETSSVLSCSLTPVNDASLFLAARRGRWHSRPEPGCESGCESCWGMYSL